MVLTFSHAIKLSALARRLEMNRFNSDENCRDRSRINNLNNKKGIFNVESETLTSFKKDFRSPLEALAARARTRCRFSPSKSNPASKFFFTSRHS